MRVSLNTIKQYIDFELPPVDELVAKINQQLGQVEKVIHLGERYEKATIVKIVSAEQHPNADRLRVCKIDDGGAMQDVPRDENGYVQVVCGAPNARAGVFAVWLPPTATVPASYDGKELFVLDARELRGILSQGMLAAADELALGSDHAGIIEINPDEWKPSDVEIKPGANFAKAYGLDDTIIDIENKMFTHRPDLFGQIGVAREIAGILGHKFTSPDWYWKLPHFATGEGLELEVFNDALEKVPRFMAVALKNIEVKPSPLWLQIELVRLGSKPINNIVDVTNYVMLLTAQPTHAYDYDKIRGRKLGVRMASNGEKITLLNHKEYELTEDDIVIVDGDGPVGLAGIMGGGESEVDEQTKNIVLEVATFDMYAVRKSSMRHGIFTDALTRFNKGQSPYQNEHVLSLLMTSIFDVSTGEQASPVYDEHQEGLLDNVNRNVHDLLKVEASFINDRLGLALDEKAIEQLLRNVEFACFIDDGDTATTFAAPFWRTDIELPEDIVEEVGRLYGFDKLPRELPQRSIKPATKNPLIVLKRQVRERLSRAGANEVLTYSFVHGNLLEKSGQDKAHAYELSNALSPDLQYYRLSLMPSLLAKVHPNIRAGYDKFALFELGKAHLKDQNDSEGLPREDELIGLVVAATDKSEQSNAAYYLAKQYLDTLVDADVSYREVPPEMREFDITKPYEMRRSAFAYVGDTFIGIIGEFRPEVSKALKLPDYCAGFELDTAALVGVLGQMIYTPLSRYPSSERDICFQVASSVQYADIISAVDGVLKTSTFETSVTPLDIYQPADGQTKNVTIRIKVTSYDHTLTSDEVAQLTENVAQAVIAATNATVI